MRTNWPYIVPRPGRGEVRACPICGNVAVFSCYHRYSVRTTVMNAAKAAYLRRTSGEYKPRIFVCTGCDYEGPLEARSTFGGGQGWRCARCSGETERQITEARRQVAAI